MSSSKESSSRIHSENDFLNKMNPYINKDLKGEKNSIYGSDVNGERDEV